MTRHCSANTHLAKVIMNANADICNLTCSVCHRLFRKPKYLPCFHSYCERCLKEMQMQSKIKCPQCGKVATVPPGGVKELNDNSSITHLVDKLILKRKEEGNCEECLEKYPATVEGYCLDCFINLCDACIEHHKCNSDYKCFGIVKLNLMSCECRIRFNSQCNLKELQFYCNTCDKLISMYCAARYHYGHSFTTVKDLAVKYKQELEKTTAAVEEMIKGLANAPSDTEKMREKIRQQGDKVKNNIDLHYDEVIQKLMEQKEQLKKQTQVIVSQKEKAIVSQQECTQMKACKMKDLNEDVKIKSDQEIIYITKQMINLTENITDKYNKVRLPSVQDTIEFVPNKDTLPQLGLLISAAEPDPHNCEVVDPPKYSIKGKKTEITVITEDEDGVCCSVGSSVNIRLEGVGDTVQVRDNDNGSYVASFVPQQLGKVKMSVLINEQQIKGSPYSIMVKDYTSLNKPSKVVNDNGNMGRPWGIAFSKNGMWAVSDWSNHLVYIFDDEDQLVTMFGGYGFDNSQFHHPQGVVFDNDGCLFVVDSANHRVQKFNPEMKYLLKFGSKGSRDMELESPNGLAVHGGKAYVSDRGNKRMSVFKTDGIFHRTVGSGVLGCPYDVTVTGDDQLLIADCGHRCIYRLTLDGRYIGKFGTNQSELYIPSSVSVDLYGFIFITDAGKHCVSIYSKDGVFMHSFGSSGSASNQFEPYGVGVAVSANGHIYVSDHNNKRIQIFSN